MHFNKFLKFVKIR